MIACAKPVQDGEMHSSTGRGGWRETGDRCWLLGPGEIGFLVFCLSVVIIIRLTMSQWVATHSRAIGEVIKHA